MTGKSTRFRNRRIKKKLLIFLCITIFIVLCSSCGADHEDQDMMQEQIQEITVLPLKFFNAVKLDGEEATFEMFSERSAVIIYFWSTWSNVSQYHLKEIAECKKNLPSDVLLITACIDGENRKQDAKRILKEAGYKGTTIIVGDNHYYSLINAIQYVPTTVFFDNSGQQIRDPVIGIDMNLSDIIKEVSFQYTKIDEELNQ